MLKKKKLNINNLVTEFYDFIDGKYNKRLNILDFECGDGILGVEVNKVLAKKYFFNLDGIDSSQNNINLASSKNVYRKLWNLDFTHEMLPQQYQYDLILCHYIFLVDNTPTKIIDNILDCLTIQGFLFLPTNSYKYIKYLVENPRVEFIHNFNLDYGVENCKLYILKKLF